MLAMAGCWVWWDLHPTTTHPLLCLTPRLKDAFRCFLEDNQVSAAFVDTLTNALDPNIEVKNILSVWRTAARTSQANVSAYGQERPAQGSN